MKKIILIVLILLVVIFIHPAAQAQTKQDKIALGIIITHMAVSPTAILEGCRPFAKYLSQRLNTQTEVEILQDIDSLIKGLDNGTLDAGYVSNLDYVKLKSTRDVTPFAKVVKGGSSTYNAILLVRKDSGINTLSGLKGKSFAFTSKNSSHGYLYPSLLIKSTFKMPLESFFSKIIPTKKDPDGILAVLYKRADAVSASSQTYAILCELMPRLKRELKVISTSEPLVHGPMFVYNKNIKDKTLPGRLKNEVLTMDKSTEGKQVLLLFKIGGWTSASDSDYNSLRRMLQQ